MGISLTFILRQLRIQDIIKDKRYSFYIKRNIPLPVDLRNLVVRDAITNAHTSYQPKVYPGKLIFFRVANQNQEYVQHIKGW